jgi:hypothetical protein
MTPSEVVAGTWIAGGVVATGVLQWATHGEHSVSDGLRRHPVATTVLAVAFACHLARRPRCLAWADPFHALGVVTRRRHP